MAYDLEEQEQIDTLKAWWKQYGNLVTWLLIICLTAFAGWTYWNNYQSGQAVQASQLYEELQRAAQAKDNAKVQRAAGDLIDKFGKTAYAPMAALSAAKSAFDANDLKAAKARLQWVIDQGGSEEYKALAGIRLAGIALDEKAYDDGLKLLAGDFPAEFAGEVADRKGDIYTAQNKIAEARTAYQTALEKTNEKNPGRQLIQLKLEAIGGTAAKVASK
ncbi:YfgM family protein [Undibacterium sp.]|uniref:YfgM family protein n=1 Tax=Undibacterium sp. TaxID=1914977 RepID=UPI00374DA312